MNKFEIQDYLAELYEDIKKNLSEFSNKEWNEYDKKEFIGEAADGKVKLTWKGAQFTKSAWNDVSLEALPDLICTAATRAIISANNERKAIIRREDEFIYNISLEASKRATQFFTSQKFSDKDLTEVTNFVKSFANKKSFPGTN